MRHPAGLSMRSYSSANPTKHAWAPLLLLAASVLSAPAHAFVYTVDSTDDAVDADTADGICATATSSCTLRAAIQQANAWPGHDFIILPAGTYTLTLAGRGEQNAASGDLDVSDNLTLRGAGAGVTVIDAAGIDRAFDLIGENTRLEISGVTITNGRAEPQNSPADNGVGGGIRSQGVLVLRDSVISDNFSNPSNIGFAGGGIHHSNIGEALTLLLDKVTVSGNSASGTVASGGGIAMLNGNARIERSVISGNAVDSPELPPAGGADGGGIGVGNGNLTIVDSTISGNSAMRRGGGISSFAAGPAPGAGMLIERSTISGNSAYFGGGIYDDGAPSRTIAISNSTISGNIAVPPPGSGFDGATGGGLYLSKPTTLLNVTIAGNSAQIGGGLYVDPVGIGGAGGNQGSATIAHTIIAGAAIDGGTCAGAVANITANGPNLGSNADCNMGGIVADPQLGALAAGNGGPTAVHLPLGGSPAIDAGSNALCPTVDQRGFPRPVGNCDIGAVESTPGVQADLALNGLDHPDPVAAGTPLAYTLDLVNQGPSAATGAQISVNLPAGLSFSSGDAGCAPAGATVNCDVGALAAGAAASRSITVTPAAPGTVTSTAGATAAQNDPVPGNSSGIEIVTDVYTPTDLVITKSAETTGIVIPAGGGDPTTGTINANDTIIAGQPFTYILTLDNTGGTARNTRIYDTLPEGIRLTAIPTITPTAAGRACSFAGQNISCELGDVPAGAGTAVIRIPVLPDTRGTKLNRALGSFDGTFVTAPPADELPIEVDTRTDLAIAMVASAEPVTVGADLAYIITVNNSGPSIATAPRIEVALAGNVSFESASAEGWNCQAADGGIECLRATLNAGASSTVTLFVVPQAVGTITATATIAGDDTDPNPGNNTAAVTTNVIAGVVSQHDLAVSLIATPSTGVAGSNLSLISIVRNIGNDTAEQVILTQTLPAGVTFQSSSFPCSRDGVFLQCDMGTIIAGTDARITVVVRPEAPGSITTSIVALDAGGTDTDLSNNNASLTVTIEAAPGPGLRGGGHCFIATAAYGSYLDPHVVTLRRFRDEYLLTHPAGAGFVAWYYEVSPPLAAVIAEHEALRTLTRWTLTPVVYAAAYPLPASLLALGIVLAALRRRGNA